MIELLAAWEEGWLQPDTEAFIWRQLCNAFDVDKCMAVPRRIPVRTSVFQYDCIQDALGESTCEPIYLMPAKTVKGDNLATFEHPENACYIFGRAGENNKRHMQEGDRAVTIYSPKNVDIFAVNAAAIVLYDRMVKHVR